MKDRPILFSGAMVRALLAGTKTQTRRVIKGEVYAIDELASETIEDLELRGWGSYEHPRFDVMALIPFVVGNRLWVRETWKARMTHGWTIADARSRLFQEEILYQADGHEKIDGWWPSIHMPREFSRLTLIVTDVRVQRLQDISEADAIAEGCPGRLGPNPDFPDEWDPSPIEEYRALWERLNADRGYGWDTNPWIVAVTFDVEKRNIDRRAR